MLKEPHIESFIRISRLRWLGHVGCMENHRNVKIVTAQKNRGNKVEKKTMITMDGLCGK